MAKFGIVKYAADGYWKFMFTTDPKLGKIHPSYSAHDTFTGKTVEIKESYPSRSACLEDLKKMNNLNPCVGYDICEFL